MNIDEVVKKVGIPTPEWEGQCYGMALALLEAGVVEGEARYGHWLGPVAEGTMFANRPLIHHGWIEVEGGDIVDPTRWVFEGVEPYIYEGPNDFYDAGGNVYLMLNMTAPPVRTYARDERTVELDLPDEIEAMLPGAPARKSIDQAYWLGNLPLPVLGPHAEAVYRALIAAKLGASIPIDNRRLVLGNA